MVKVTKSEMQILVDRHMKYADERDIAHFKNYVLQGIEPWLAAIHATGDIPGVTGTDTQFMAGSEKQFERCPQLGEMTKRMKPGYTKGARYHNGLGRWVHDQGDIKRWAKKLNKTIETPEGKVLHQGHYVHQESVPIAEDSIRDLMNHYARKDPDCAATPAKRKKLRETVIEKHTPANKKKLLKG